MRTQPGDARPIGFCMPVICGVLVFVMAFPLHAAASLEVVTETRVDEAGAVRILLSLKNAGSDPVYEVHPRVHFHHTRSLMPRIISLEPGQTVTLENTEHPPVVLTGRYPLTVMVNYRGHADRTALRTHLHTDSFYFREPVVSMIEGEMESTSADGQSSLKVLLRNTSSAFKNVRLMLVMPPGLVAENFGGMMGMTIRGGEEKSFSIPLRRVSGGVRESYPVHLMIEYAEMLKHYTGEIRGNVRFPTVWTAATVWPHLFALTLLSLLMWVGARRKKRRRSSD